MAGSKIKLEQRVHRDYVNNMLRFDLIYLYVIKGSCMRT